MLSVIIVNYKSPEICKLCVASIIETIKNTPYEVIVVDAETDGEFEDVLLADFPTVKFVGVKENPGYSTCVNKGIKRSSGDYLLILNPDIIAEDHAIDKMLAYIKSQDKIGMLGPRLLNFNGTAQNSAFRFPTFWTIVFRRTFLGKFGFGKKHLDRFLYKDRNIEILNTPMEVDWLMGSAMLAPKKAIEKVGKMDERFFMYFEDVDWARSFWENGYKVVYFPEAKMHHYHKKASGRRGIFDIFFNRMTRVHIVSAYKYFKKHRL